MPDTHELILPKPKKKTSAFTLALEQRIMLWLSLPLAALLITCSTVGLLYPGMYAAATPNWLTQTVVQDGVNLFIISPVFLVATLYSFQGVKAATIMWGGTITYLVYTFLIYCFAVPFNSLFLPYCAILGLSVFGLILFLFQQARNPFITRLSNGAFLNITGIYFIFIAIVFSALWLLEVIPASMANTAPQTLIETGLLTNPVHVIDLSIFLPLVFITGLMTLKGRPLASILIPVVLVFFVLMDVTIATLTVVMIREGFGGHLAVAVGMGVLAIFSLTLLVAFVRIARAELET